MLRAVSDLALEHGFPCWLSIEERMACGYGVCNACVVEQRCDNTERGEGWFLKSCVEGPVFEAREIHV
jgi:dihydroorotate dehydrogenase electron transfer subunit